MAVSFIAGRVYQPRHAAPPGLFWRSLLSRNDRGATDEPPQRRPERAMTSTRRSGPAPGESQSRTGDRRPWQ